MFMPCENPVLPGAKVETPPPAESEDGDQYIRGES
jgi:hypothetical protein